MLKQLSSLVLVLVIGGSVMAVTARVRSQHLCKLAGTEIIAGTETMPCCHEELSIESRSPKECCVAVPRERGSKGTTFNPRPPTLGFAASHPSAAQAPLPELKTCESWSSVFIPNFQASYIRNLSLLI
jgi:hypothetical protein